MNSPEYEADKQKHVKTSQKRQRDVEHSEEVKRKVFRPNFHRLFAQTDTNISAVAPLYPGPCHSN